jgi:hypothetical protein
VGQVDDPGEIELTLEPRTDHYDPHDDRWRAEVSDLLSGLDREVGGVRQERSPVTGAKGGVEAVIVALGSAGAFTATVEYLRAWLGRDRTRSLEISWSVDGQEQSVSVRGEAIDQSALQQLAGAVATRIGGVEWAAGGTEPS